MAMTPVASASVGAQRSTEVHFTRSQRSCFLDAMVSKQRSKAKSVLYASGPWVTSAPILILESESTGPHARECGSRALIFHEGAAYAAYGLPFALWPLFTLPDPTAACLIRRQS